MPRGWWGGAVPPPAPAAATGWWWTAPAGWCWSTPRRWSGPSTSRGARSSSSRAASPCRPAHGGEAIGLYRTEYLFLGRSDLPSEDEHYQNYRRILEAVGRRPVTIR